MMKRRCAPCSARPFIPVLQRKMEYGVAAKPDYLGRGAKAGFYTSFIIKELLPCIHDKFDVIVF